MIGFMMSLSILSFGQFINKNKLSPIIKDSVDHKEFSRILSVNDSPINLNTGINMFLNQHRTGNHIMIVGAIITTVGCLYMGSAYHKDFNPDNTGPGLVMASVGG